MKTRIPIRLILAIALLIGMFLYAAASQYWQDLLQGDPVALTLTGVLVSIPLLVGLVAAILAIRERRKVRARQRGRQDAPEAATAPPADGRFPRPAGLLSERPTPTAVRATRPAVPRGKRLCPHC